MTQQFQFWNISEETQKTNLKMYMHLYVHCRIVCNSQDLEAVQVSISRWVDKKVVVHLHHLHNGILLGHKKEGNLPFVTAWMDLESIGYQRKTNTIWFQLYVECNEQNKQNRNELIDPDTDWQLLEGRGIGELGERGKGIEWNRTHRHRHSMVITRAKVQGR